MTSSVPVITGLGFITSIGNDRATVSRNLRDLRHGFERIEFLGNPDLPVRVGGTIKGFSFPTPQRRDWRWPEAYPIERDVLRGLAPHGVYAYCALHQALADAGLSIDDLADGTTGLFCGLPDSSASPAIFSSDWENFSRLIRGS